MGGRRVLIVLLEERGGQGSKIFAAELGRWWPFDFSPGKNNVMLPRQHFVSPLVNSYHNFHVLFTPTI